MTVFDHLLFVGLAVAYPVASVISFRRLLRRIAAGEVVAPTEIYRSTVLGHWLLFAIAVALWLLSGRPWHALGFGLDLGSGFLIGLALTVGAIVVLVRQYGGLEHASEKTRASLRRQLGDLEFIMPRNEKELRQFYGVSVTAGIVEETLWRGFLFWYLAHAMPLWAAAVASSVLFGIGHAYQGAASLPKVTLVGGVFAALYILTGSIWLPMVLHAVFDAVQGRAVYKLLSSASLSPSSAASTRIRES